MAVEPEAKANPEAKPKPDGKATPKAKCLATFNFDSGGSVLEEQRSRGGAKRWDDFAKRYTAAYLDPDHEHPVNAVDTFRIGGTPLLWFTPDFATAVVNAAVLSDLAVVDAMSLGVGERAPIGSLGELGQGKIKGRDLLHFLMRADVIQTYAHIGSTVCLMAETHGEGGYQARLSGEHVYFTNQKNRDAFAFSFVLDADGTISITGI
ncbi:MAG: hypothetical protein KUG77_18300 [Nannocystaceae bacterium]|nr:hypothetical protein [Nannocystaceae bacterium]